MKIWFDTEFIEDGITIDLISIGMVREDGHYYYAESNEVDKSKASQWVVENVYPHLDGGIALRSRAEIADDLIKFCGLMPEFWAYYCSYDWVVLCQLFGTMMHLPEGFPMYCNDIKQLCNSLGNPELPKQSTTKHNALNDALWTKKAWEKLVATQRQPHNTNRQD